MKRNLLLLITLLIFLASTFALSIDPKWTGPLMYSPPAPHKAGDTITFSAPFKETFGAVDNLKIAARIDGVHIWHKVYPHLNGGQSMIVSTTWVATPGMHKFTFIIDPQNISADTDRSNNIIEHQFTVYATSGSPYTSQSVIPGTNTGQLNKDKICSLHQNESVDLVIENLRGIANPVKTNKTIEFKVKNNGKKCLRSFRYSIRTSFNQLIAYDTVNPVGANKYALYGNSSRKITKVINISQIYQFKACKNNEYSQEQAGTPGYDVPEYNKCNKWTVHIDPMNDITETNESNNKALISIFWSGIAY